MTTAVISKLAELIRLNKTALLERWRGQVRALPSAAHLDIPTLNDHIPALLEELALALEQPSEKTIAETLKEGTPPEHGIQRFEDGFDITEVVAEYNILRGCVHDLSLENNLRLEGKPFHILNRVLDEAIGLAVKTHAGQRALEVKQRREEYLAFVAHDLRNPLTAISMAASALEMILEEQPGNVESAQMLATLHRNARQLEALVAKLLEENTDRDPDEGVRPVKRNFELWPLVQAIVQDMKPLATPSGTTLINLVADDVVVYADSSLMRRVFQNLISNAISYSPGGEVRVGGRKNEEDGTMVCWVTDTGTGIPAHLLESVFEKGVGDPEREESTGLGLAIVKSFVEAHGGEVHAESEEGHGTTIRFTLPAPSDRIK
ncbi:MAG: HAMP domain-containing sensor histidine kinase [Flavobacteriales bacterium]